MGAGNFIWVSGKDDGGSGYGALGPEASQHLIQFYNVELQGCDITHFFGVVKGQMPAKIIHFQYIQDKNPL
jgi:hypothetical protein